MTKLLHIAIDGPVAAGKGTIASRLAKKFNLSYIETGAMYRAVAFIGMQDNISLSSEKKLLNAVKNHVLEVRFSKGKTEKCKIIIDGKDVTEKLHTPEISEGSSKVAVYPQIRAYLVEKQKKIAKNRSVVMEGRDIGTVVLPKANIKIFLTADIHVRAMRRLKQLKQKGIVKSFDQVLEETKKRDYMDTHRKKDPLKKAPDAILVDSTHLSIDETVLAISRIIKSKL